MGQETRLSGKLKLNRVVIENFDDAQELYKGGFGEKEKKNLVLNPYEALFLCSINKVDVVEKKKIINFDTLIGLLYNKDKEILNRFLVYRDLRSRGFVVKEGFGFGIDFRVYDKGEYGKKGAKYVVFTLNEGNDVAFEKILQHTVDIKRMGKKAIMAVIDRSGEVIYYHISELVFNAES
jgi:tRNA-intron endonuclease